MVVDGDVGELPTDRAAIAAGCVAFARPVGPGGPAADAFAGAAFDPAELFDVDVDELAGPGALIADRLLESIRPSLPMPLRLSTTETVESGIASVSAISAAVIRSCRNDTIRATRSGGVRLATRLGAEDRSRRPASPAALYRATHLRAQRTLTPAATAAALIVQPCSSTRTATSRRPLQLRAALR
jgi:hypothetical protein